MTTATVGWPISFRLYSDMKRSHRNILIALGVVLALVLLGLRVVGELHASSSGLGALAELMGYEEPKDYAVLVVGVDQPTMLLRVRVDQGDTELVSAIDASGPVRALARSDFPAAADILLKGQNIDAVAFITYGAAGEAADAFGGFYQNGKQVTSQSIPGLVQSLLASPEAISAFNGSVELQKSKLVTRGTSMLSVAKGIFARGEAAVYFKGRNPFGKPCIGACKAELFEQLSMGGKVGQ